MTAPSDSVSVIIRDARGRMLLQLRDSEQPTNPLRFGCFGGHFEEGETDPVLVAVREIEEELDTVFNAGDLKVIDAHDDGKGRTRYVILFTRPFEPEGGLTVREGAGGNFLTTRDLQNLRSMRMLSGWIPECFDRLKLW